MVCFLNFRVCASASWLFLSVYVCPILTPLPVSSPAIRAHRGRADGSPASQPFQWVVREGAGRVSQERGEKATGPQRYGTYAHEYTSVNNHQSSRTHGEMNSNPEFSFLLPAADDLTNRWRFIKQQNIEPGLETNWINNQYARYNLSAHIGRLVWASKRNCHLLSWVLASVYSGAGNWSFSFNLSLYIMVLIHLFKVNLLFFLNAGLLTITIIFNNPEGKTKTSRNLEYEFIQFRLYLLRAEWNQFVLPLD